MDKGTRVRIIDGPGRDQLGTVFWVGENRYGSGSRFGVEGDDGRTWWINDTDCEALAGGEDPGRPEGPTFDKGDRVGWTLRGVEGTGKVFWIGESRRGGQRLGINDDHGEEALWLDARQVHRLEDQSEPAPQEEASTGGSAPPAESTWEPAPAPTGPPPMDGPPVDDGWYDSLAASVDEDEPPPDAW